jgi:hypothetical protein
LITFLKTLQILKQEWQKKSSPGTRQTDGKNLVWFGEIERKLAKLSMPNVLPLNYFMVQVDWFEDQIVEMQKKLRTAETIENRKQITECVEMMRQHRYSGFSLFFFFLNLLCNAFLAVLGIRDILVRILIRGSVPLTNGSGSDSKSRSNSFLQMQKKIIFSFFSYNLSAGTLSSVLKIKFFAKILCKILFCTHYFSPLNLFMREGKNPEPDPYL